MALFRARTAARDDKCSAVAALARVLEDRRDLLRAKLLSRDEGALFQIANQFDVRHRRADQRPDYDEAYLLPRIKRINKVRLYRPAAGQSDAYPRLTTALTRPIRWDVIAANYDQVVKYATRSPPRTVTVCAGLATRVSNSR